jgi:hypothetical protein
LTDAKSGSLPYDSTTPTPGNCIFQGRVNESQLETVLDIFGIN